MNKFCRYIAIALALVFMMSVLPSCKQQDDPAETPAPSTDSSLLPSQGTADPTRDTLDSTGDTTDSIQDTQTEGTTGSGLLTYEEYMALSGAEQMAYYKSFETPNDFFNWLNQAIKVHDDNQNKVEADENGSYDLEDMFNGSN